MRRRRSKDAERGRPTPSQRDREVPLGAPDAPVPPRLTHESVEEARVRTRTLRLVVIIGVIIALGIPAYGAWSVLLDRRGRSHRSGEPGS